MPTPLALAESQVGVSEKGGPDGKSGNIVRYWDWWKLLTKQPAQGSSWCAVFVSWCFSHAGHELHIAGKPGYIYCPTGEAFFKKAGKLTTAAKAKPNDIAFFQFDNDKEADHTGIVEAVDVHHGIITCIEGNTSSPDKKNASQSNGGGVYRRSRPFSVVKSIGQTGIKG